MSRPPVILTREQIEEAKRLLEEGYSTIRVASEVGVPSAVILKARHAGDLPKPAPRRGYREKDTDGDPVEGEWT